MGFMLVVKSASRSEWSWPRLIQPEKSFNGNNRRNVCHWPDMLEQVPLKGGKAWGMCPGTMTACQGFCGYAQEAERSKSVTSYLPDKSMST